VFKESCSRNTFSEKGLLSRGSLVRFQPGGLPLTTTPQGKAIPPGHLHLRYQAHCCRSWARRLAMDQNV